MNFKLFGWEFGEEKTSTKTKQSETPIPAPIISSDPSVQVTTGYGLFQAGYNYGVQPAQNVQQTINYRRMMALNPVVEFCIDEVINEMVDFSIKVPFKLNFTENTTLSVNVQKKLTESFERVSYMYSKNLGQDLRRWYVDGIAAWFIQLSEDRKNILSLKPIEPWMIKKVTPTRIEIVEGVNTYIEEEPYYLYNQDGIVQDTNKAIKLVYDSVLYIDSEKRDINGNVVSYLDAAIKPINDLLSLENATVIYRLTRAPEKRAFYVDTGQLPTNKAEEYVNALMKRFKTKLDYDSKTGVVKTSNQNVISATVDYWMPRREGSQGTEMTLISETSNSAISGINDDINYFRKNAYRALKIPESRVTDNPTFNLGQSGSITREEVKFSQFIDRISNIYTKPLLHLLRVDLMLKGIMNEAEFNSIADELEIQTINNDFFAETKRLEVLAEKLDLIDKLNNYVGKYFTQEYVFKEILNLTEEEIEEVKEQMKKEEKESPSKSDDDF